MTDNDIIKALRCCADRYCKGCSEKGKANCRESVAALAWDLIYRLKSEVERLEKSLIEQFDSYENIRKKAKAEAIKEFAERVKKYFNPDSSYDIRQYIDDLVKEMVGEQQ